MQETQCYDWSAQLILCQECNLDSYHIASFSDDNRCWWHRWRTTTYKSLSEYYYWKIHCEIIRIPHCQLFARIKHLSPITYIFLFIITNFKTQQWNKFLIITRPLNIINTIKYVKLKIHSYIQDSSHQNKCRHIDT